jgi:hypothetical protein
MISMARGFGAPGQGARGERGGQQVVRRGLRLQPPDDGRHDVMHVGILLDLHELNHADGARRADAAQIVASEVHEHEVFGALLGVGQQIRHELGILVRRGTPRTGTGDRVQHRSSPVSLTSASGLLPTMLNPGRVHGVGPGC